jgi:hypothetical protein
VIILQIGYSGYRNHKTHNPVVIANLNYDKTMIKLTIILTAFILLGCGSKTNLKNRLKQSLDSLTTAAQVKNDWTFKKVEKSKLVFRNRKTFETNLFDLEYIGQFQAKDKAPFLIFSGRECQECDANISIYIHSPSDGKIVVDYGQNRYEYPGTEKDYQSDTVLVTSRAFYGQVLENVHGVIWYENVLLENGKMGKDIFLRYLENGSLNDTVFEDKGEIRETLILMKKGLCKEIKGRIYSSEP